MAQKTEVTRNQKILLVIIAIVGLYFFLTDVYGPLGDDISSTQEVLDEMRREAADMQVEAARLEGYEKELESLEGEMKEIERKLPDDEELSGFIRNITNTAGRYGIDVKTFVPEGSRSSDYYDSHYYRVDILSDYHTFGRFFTDIGNLERVFNIRNVDMASHEEESGEGMLNAVFHIVAFTFRE